ncbi:putative metal-binding motif-containing protein [Myxococcota bacterium]|nr:putative metal-binding motif-containing protein [Myxococcota bacterium]
MTCQDCTEVEDTCGEGTCQSVAWTSFAYHDDDELDIHTIEDAVRARSDALRFIYGAPSLPTGTPVVETHVDSPMSGLDGLDHVDRLTMELSHGFTSVAYLFHPVKSNGKLMIFHQGHSVAYAADGGQQAVDFFLGRGWQVVAMCMPLYGECTGPYASHGEMYSATFEGASYLQFFLQPVAEVVNYAQDDLGAREIGMIGISGGGWTTTLAAALDPRIRVSVPVAGSLPIYLRSHARDLGDAEQYGYEFYQVIGYPDLYVLGSIGAGRRQLQVLNRYDSCCFAGTLYQDYEDEVAARVEGLAPGAFSVFLDQSHSSHQISRFALEAAIGHAVDGDGITIVDDIAPAYGAFQAVGAWQEVADSRSVAGRQQESSVAGDRAAWTHTGEPGEYRVSITWGTDPALSTAVPLTLSADRDTELAVDQAAAPSGWSDATAAWQDLATNVVSSTGVLRVTMVVPEGAPARADAVRFERLCTVCTWYADADGDGFGDADVTRTACAGGEGWVDAAGDCDDARADVYPGAVDAPEDGVDQDCDGSDAAGGGDGGGEGDGGEDPSDSGDGGDARPPRATEDGGCACASGSGGGGLGLWLGAMALVAVGRRRHGSSAG